MNADADRSTKKVAVVTSSRADYGLLQPLLQELENEPSMQLLLYVTGTHLLAEHGHTLDQIREDGFQEKQCWPVKMHNSDAMGIAGSVSETIGLATKSFAADRPDILILLGDRYEIFATAAAAAFTRVPIAHLHGGETSEGAVDEVMRHAITKMSHWHFTAADAYRDRVVQMGEAPERVFCFGAPGMDVIRSRQKMNRAEILSELKLPESARYLLITYHPVTLSDADPVGLLDNLLQALDMFSDHRLVFTGVNADEGGDRLSARVREYVEANPDRASFYASLGQRRYLSAVEHADAVVGNSSSGIIEAPALRTPTVNIGDRQKGRLQAASVLQADDSVASITEALQRAVSGEFQAGMSSVISLYGGVDGEETVSEQILAVLKNIPVGQGVMKSFHDIAFDRP